MIFPFHQKTKNFFPRCFWRTLLAFIPIFSYMCNTPSCCGYNDRRQHGTGPWTTSMRINGRTELPSAPWRPQNQVLELETWLLFNLDLISVTSTFSMTFISKTIRRFLITKSISCQLIHFSTSHHHHQEAAKNGRTNSSCKKKVFIFSS